MPLLAGEIMLLTALILVHGERMGKRLRYGMLFCNGNVPHGSAGGQAAVSLCDGKNGGQEIYMEGLREIQEYCNAEPEVCDGFTASNGVPYLIYYFDGEYCIEER